MTIVQIRTRSGTGNALSLGEWAVSKDASELLSCVGLGSCVAITMHDAAAGVGGMAHMVLPDSTAGRGGSNGAKFVDVAVPLLLEAMTKAGANPRRLRVCLAGGAQMLAAATAVGTANIGARNAEAAREQLMTLGLRAASQDLGGNRGRTVRLEVGSGRVTVAMPGETEVEL